MFGQALRPVLRCVPKGIRPYMVDMRPGPTMNDLPAPQGSWQQHYDKMQTKYNMQLLVAIGVLVGSIVLGRATGSLYLNAAPPQPKQ